MKTNRIKTVSYLYSPYHIKTLEKYLEHMASKGWLLKQVLGDKLTFTQIENLKVIYDAIFKD